MGFKIRRVMVYVKLRLFLRGGSHVGCRLFHLRVIWYSFFTTSNCFSIIYYCNETFKYPLWSHVWFINIENRRKYPTDYNFFVKRTKETVNVLNEMLKRERKVCGWWRNAALTVYTSTNKNLITFILYYYSIRYCILFLQFNIVTNYKAR